MITNQDSAIKDHGGHRMKVLESKPWFRAPRYRLDCDCGYKGLWYRTDFIPTAQWNYHHDLITFNELMRQHQIARITGNE